MRDGISVEAVAFAIKRLRAGTFHAHREVVLVLGAFANGATIMLRLWLVLVLALAAGLVSALFSVESPQGAADEASALFEQSERSEQTDVTSPSHDDELDDAEAQVVLLRQVMHQLGLRLGAWRLAGELAEY